MDETDSSGLVQSISVHNNSTNVPNHSTNVPNHTTNVPNHTTNVLNHSTNVSNISTNTYPNISSEQDMDFAVDPTSTSDLTDPSKEELQHVAPEPLKARDSIYLSRTNVQNGTGLLSKQAVQTVHNRHKVPESTSMPQQSTTVPTKSTELTGLSTNTVPIITSLKSTSPMASLTKKIKQDSLYLMSSTSSIKVNNKIEFIVY